MEEGEGGGGGVSGSGSGARMILKARIIQGEGVAVVGGAEIIVYAPIT